MKIKTYQAATMQDAIKQIKTELGPDAVILSTRQVRATSGTLALLGRHLVEVTAAIDVAPPGKGPLPVSPAGAPPLQNSFEEALQKRLNAADPIPVGRDNTAASLGPVLEQMREELCRVRDVMESMQKERQDAVATLNGANASMPVTRGRLYRYLDLVLPGRLASAERGAAVRRMSSEPVATTAPVTGGWLELLPVHLASLYYAFVGTGMAAEHARHLVSALHERAGSVDLTSEAEVRQAARKALAKEIIVGGPVLGPNERKKTVILVGPTGAGKTTTIAKLAAYYRLQEQRKVVLITLDTYRMAAVEQLRAYARLLEVPLEVALTKADAVSCIHRHDKAELVLIDTMGRSPRDQAGMEELKRLISLDHPVETHLVLSATTRQRDLLDSFTRFSGVPIHRLLFTKLDETSSYGAMATVAKRTQVPLSYLGIGQEVPDDFLVARGDIVADLVLGGTLPPRETVRRREGSMVNG